MDELRRALEEAQRLADEYRDRRMPVEVARRWNELVSKAERLTRKAHEMGTDWSREIPDSILPAVPSGAAEGLTPGEAFVRSDAFAQYKASGFPRGPSAKVLVPPFTKAVPTIGTSVVQPSRMPGTVRVFEQDRLVLRDAITTVPTSSNVVEFLRLVSEQPSGATPVAPGAVKPESTVELDIQTAPVRTIAVHMPVLEQQLQDVVGLPRLIDQYLGFDISRAEEYQMIWGDGLSENLLGLMNVSGVTEFTRTLPGTPTLLDKVRGMMTDIRKQNLEPTALVIDSIDWETIVLLKGSDSHYLAQMFPTADGSPRVWSLQVIETPATSQYRKTGVTTPQRVMMVGDFRRGATLFDRQTTTVEVGYINDQFIRNQRTIRAEERVAFATPRPKAFKWVESQAEVP